MKSKKDKYSKSEIVIRHGPTLSTLSMILKNKDLIKSNFERCVFILKC